MSVDQSPTPTTVRPPSPGLRTSPLRALLLRVHFWSGLIVGPFLLVAALSGFLYTLTPSIEPLLYRSVLTVPAAPSSLPLAVQVAAGQAAVPGAELSSVRPAPTPTDTTRVIFSAPDLGDSSHYRTAFVDPHTGAVTGVLHTYGGSQALPLREWVDQLHDNLHLGDPGRLYAELAASWLWVLALGGLVLWVGMWRRRRASARALLLPRNATGRRARLLSWHGTVGLWAVIGLLFLAATGLTWSTYAGANVTALRGLMAWDTPSPASSVPGAVPTTGAGSAEHAGHAGMAGMAGMETGPAPTVPAAPPTATPQAVEAAYAAALRAGLSGPMEVVPASEPGATTGVAEISRVVSGSDPVVGPLEGLRNSTHLDAVAIDPSSGTVIDTVRFADWPLAAKLARWGVDAHMGMLFGVANQIVLAALALGLACGIVWGSVLWWRRGPGRRGGTVPPRGAFLALSRPWQVGVVAGTVLVAAALPLLGASLLIALAADAAAAGGQDRRAAASPAAGAS
ncbi:PepSY-associated TM helix domain-containing protein [Actinomycetospora soli]|uniref:PepSY-associated TM helix domain-containing protein n=1 Tax=Actinomycetospora soli TaxID=2893887 RepID=UPI001E42E4E2|nr:PepSY-associated TM helix domain-containing protein [Actinomycetospora soli]MCD2187158.1 PepSY domain-containing protein [Actinomycetospora soli]